VIDSLLVCSLLIWGQAAEQSADEPAKADTAKTGAAKASAKADAPAAKNEELEAKVRLLVRQLDSDQQARREAAEKELIALGEDVLPLLPPIGRTTPAEVKNRIGRVRAALEKAAIEATTRTRHVTLKGEMLLSEALAELKRQTGNRIVDSRDMDQSDPRIKLELENAPFWQALDTILDAAELTLYNYDSEQGALSYVARDSNALARVGRGFYNGIFRLEPTKIEIDADLRNPAARSLRLTVDAAWEPRVRPVVLMLPLAEFKAVDENGADIAVAGGEGELEFPVEGFNAGSEMDIPLALPPRSVKQIASLKGKLTAVLLGREETFEFANPEMLPKGIELERGGVVVVLDQCRMVDELLEVRMRVRFDKANNALESHRGWIYNNPCYLTDGKDTKIENAALEADLLEDNEVRVVYRFDLGDEKSASRYKLVYKTPAAIITVPVEFELKNIELP
jgi:hypothetical protein